MLFNPYESHVTCITSCTLVCVCRTDVCIISCLHGYEEPGPCYWMDYQRWTTLLFVFIEVYFILAGLSFWLLLEKTSVHVNIASDWLSQYYVCCHIFMVCSSVLDSNSMRLWVIRWSDRLAINSYLTTSVWVLLCLTLNQATVLYWSCTQHILCSLTVWAQKRVEINFGFI